MKFTLITSFLFFLTISAIAPSTDLVTMKLLDEKIELSVPSEFDIMSEEMMNIKYPTTNRPTLVYTDERGKTNIGLNLTANPANQDAIGPMKEMLEQTMKAQFPSAEWKSSGVEVINGRKVGYLEFITPAIDTEIYNHIFFTDVDEKLLLCTFNCVKADMKKWQSTALEIRNSLKVN